MPNVPYPECGEESEDPLAEGRVMVSGPDMRERDLVERFSRRTHARCVRYEVHQEWPRGTADLEVIYARDGAPIRVFKRTTSPAARDPVGHRDTRVFDLRAHPVVMVRRALDAEREAFELRGERPTVVLSAGRGLLTAWIQRADLAIDERVRERALDVREPIEVIREVTLRRHANRSVARLGTVRVYTIYGREPVFADEQNIVLGDLMGLRPAASVGGPIPDPLPDPGPFDPTISP